MLNDSNNNLKTYPIVAKLAESLTKKMPDAGLNFLKDIANIHRVEINSKDLLAD